ncbi:MAG TPA: hypothetical protein VJZ27_09210, partial [Aggregatilineales bacterium]|nr:hypothetical protein [Aggregatilineales bacterium]
LLPGGRSILEVQGFAVSSGTAYPEASYALAKWLTHQPDVVERLFGAAPARQSLMGIEGSEESPFNLPDFSPEDQALIQQAVSNGISVSEARFIGYLALAREAATRENENPLVALQDAESLAVSNLQAAESMRQDTTVFVATPVPEIAPGSGEIALTFGLPINLSTLPNGDQWQQAIDDFVATDPEVGQLIQKVSFSSLEDFAETTDCFFLQQNVVPVMNLQLFLNFDPFMDADPNFDVNDLVGGVLPQIQRENLTWAYPVLLQPEILRYDSEAFIQNGAIPPQNGWTVDAFNDALRTLKLNPDDPAPFVPRNPGGNYMQILIAAYGGLPLDYRTTPVTVNYTDPATVDAIRQALDLAKNGYIEYQSLGSLFGGFLDGDEIEDFIYTELAGP